MSRPSLVSIVDSDVAFECAEGQSVLDAALRAGIGLPYSCRKGVCGNCAGTVVSGEVVGLAGASIVNETCGPGQVLLCRCTPLDEVVLRPMSWSRIDPSARKSYTVRVFRNQLVAPDVSVLQLRLPAGRRVKFRAGQYLQLTLDDGTTRCYSMANPPHESDAVTLHVRHVPGGRFSGSVAGLATGTLLRVELPFGSVGLRPDDTDPIVFVAGGTGFAPIRSIIDDMARRRVQRSITLIRGSRKAEGLYLRGAIDPWRKLWPDFRFIAALSDDSGDFDVDAFAGRVDEALRTKCPDLRGHSVYCCGSPAMVSAVREAAITSLGLLRSDFHADVFVDGPVDAQSPI